MSTKAKIKARADADKPKPKPLDLDNYVTGLISWLNNRLSADASNLYRKYSGIGISDWRVLAYLGVKGTGIGAEISDFLGMDKAAVSRSITTLRKKKLVIADATDGRKIELRLSGKGIIQYNENIAMAQKREEILLDGFDKEERALVIRLLHKMLANLPKVAQYSSDLITKT